MFPMPTPRTLLATSVPVLGLGASTLWTQVRLHAHRFGGTQLKRFAFARNVYRRDVPIINHMMSLAVFVLNMEVSLQRGASGKYIPLVGFDPEVIAKLEEKFTEHKAQSSRYPKENAVRKQARRESAKAERDAKKAADSLIIKAAKQRAKDQKLREREEARAAAREDKEFAKEERAARREEAKAAKLKMLRDGALRRRTGGCRIIKRRKR